MNRYRPIPEIQASDLAPEHIRQAMIAKLKSTPLAFEFEGKRHAFLSLRELTDRIELYTHYYNQLVASKALGQSGLEYEILRKEKWLSIANNLLNDVQAKLASGVYKARAYATYE